MDTYDIVIVGAGSAGCALANRLSARADLRVLLLEAGPPDRDPWLSMPAGFTKVFFHDTLNWGYFTEPEPHLRGRRIYWPRGRTLGGSSAINAMVYMRGHARDYDEWGLPGWAWRDVLALFKRSQRACFDGEAHGRDGELAVSQADFIHPAASAFVEAAVAAGLPRNSDFNAGDTEGAGHLHFTIDRGARASAASAFLHPIRRRRNLHVLTAAHVERVLLSERRAAGVVYRKGDQRITAPAREVILAAGAINSPHLLMLSGIGPAEHLRAMGVSVAHDSPGVGLNLQDHLYISLSVRARAHGSMNARLRGAGLALEAANYFVRRRGALALGASQASAFARSSASQDRADLQINFTPLSYRFAPGGKIVLESEPGMTLALAHLRPLSRGLIRLRSADPAASPAIIANYLDDPADSEAVLAGLKLIRRIAAQAPLADMIAAPVLAESDAALLDYVRANAGSLFHPVGSCRMGLDALAVVDPRLRVHGIEGLRVADASIMPTIVTGNTNAPAIMIGEKAADLVLEDLRR